MKILFANSMKGLGGGERWLMDTARGLRSRGHSVGVAARTRSALAEVARDAGLDVLELPMRNDIDPASVSALRAYYAAERPQLVISQIQRAHRLCVLASRLGPCVPQALRVGQLRAVIPKWFNRLTWSPLRLVLANCRAIESLLRETKLVPDPALHLLYNGLPELSLPPRAQARAALGLKPGDEAVVCVARLARLKGHRALLRAWRTVRAARPQAQLLLAGGGGAGPALSAMAAGFGHGESVRFLGELRDVGAVWAAADLSVLASEEEGLPYAVLESMAAGVPAIGTTVAGIPELIHHERTGFLVPPREPAALAREILRCLNDRELATRVASAARERVRREFAFEAQLDRCEQLFQGVAGV